MGSKSNFNIDNAARVTVVYSAKNAATVTKKHSASTPPESLDTIAAVSIAKKREKRRQTHENRENNAALACVCLTPRRHTTKKISDR